MNNLFCGLYFKRITIVMTFIKGMPQFVASLVINYAPGGIIFMFIVQASLTIVTYDRNMFIVQASEHNCRRKKFYNIDT